MRWRIIALFALTLWSIASCEKKRDSQLPYVKIHISISLTLPQFEPLKYTGNVIVYPNTGYKNNGVYIVRIAEDGFAAFDVTCTDHLDEPTATRLDGNVARCPKCKEEYYLLNYGFSLDRAKHLQQYSVKVLPGTSIVTVQN